MERKEVAPPHTPVLKPYLVETPAGVKCVSSGKLPRLNDDGESDEDDRPRPGGPGRRRAAVGARSAASPTPATTCARSRAPQEELLYRGPRSAAAPGRP